MHLTYHKSTEDEITRPLNVSEVEVTDAMLDAAQAVFENYYVGEGTYALSDECLVATFKAMMRASVS